MTEPTRPRCSSCSTPNPAGQAFCGRCGFDLGTTSAGTDAPERQPRFAGSVLDWPIHRLLKWALGLWAIAYPVVSCSPLFATGTNSGGAVAVGGLTSLVVGATLFGPWIVGVIVLGILVWITK